MTRPSSTAHGSLRWTRARPAIKGPLTLSPGCALCRLARAPVAHADRLFWIFIATP